MIITNTNIKNLIEKSGYTQKDIADYLSIESNLISKIENGECSVTSDMIYKLASLFGMSVSDLLYNDNHDTPFAKQNNVSSEDLDTIAVINRIAINANYMSELLKA